MKIDRAVWFFLLALIALTVAMGWGANALATPPPSFASPILWGMAIGTAVIFYLLKSVKVNTAANSNFALVTFYLLSIFAKFILAGIAVFLMLKLDAEGSNANVIFFMICYVAFTMLEIVGLLLARTKKDRS